ncbi:MAG: hypothetical protein IPK13_13960 [Deltaproteobacteria bacterium]|nr:hypothetical protein [Deltaproteobacteria bacterium]
MKAGRPFGGVVAILVVAILVAAGLDLWVALRGSPPEVEPAAMAAAARTILARRAKGDRVVHSPLFSMRELQGLGDLDSSPDLPETSVRASRRVLVLDKAAFPMHGFEAPADTLDLEGGLRLRVIEPSSVGGVLVFDLYEDIERLVLHIERPPGVVRSRCTAPRPEGGYGCPGEAGWLYAARTTQRIDGTNTRCVWNHPTTNGVVVLGLPPPVAPPAGRHLVLKLQAALTDEAVRTTPDGADVVTEVFQGGRALGRLVVTNRIGWVERELVVQAGAAVELRVTTPRDGRRHHVLNAQIFEAVDERSR